jgi:ElaA protein
MDLEWKCQTFDELTVDELYAILRLRSEVFVVEQNCVFLDMDNKDQRCMHVTGWQNNQLLGYTRLVPPGVAYSEPSIGRVLSSISRRTGLGRELMIFSMRKSFEVFGENPIKIGAQLYLKKFYESLGFHQTSEVYLEDGIHHIEMVFPILEN